VNYALEMIDLVIDDSIKAKLISLIDVVSDEEKLKNLHQFFPGEVPQYDQLIEDILNRDYNLISIWAKAFTLRHMTSIKNENIRQTVLSLLFSPERILREEAALLIGRTDKNLFNEVIDRIPVGSANRIGKIINGEFPASEYLYEKVRFLSSQIKDIPEDELIFLAGFIQYHSSTDFRAIKEIPDSILWKLMADYSVADVFIIFQNNIADYSDKDVSSDSLFYLLPLKTVEDFRNMFPEDSFKVFNYLDKQDNNL
jgi:AAA family ATP:ADP antiporter